MVGLHGFWQIEVEVPEHAVAVFERALGRLGSVVSAANVDAPRWSVVAYCPAEPERTGLGVSLAVAAKATGIGAAPPARVTQVAPQDWLYAAKRLDPVRVGRFFVHESDYEGPRPGRALDLCIEAGLAFGTGAHETTRGCLLAMDRLARRRRFHRPYDLGCGSGILSFGAARLWPARVLACDLDPVAVKVTRDNARINRLGGRIRAVVGDGRKPRAILGGARHDLIVANILARPLKRLAPRLAGRLAPGGFLVLAGLLRDQEPLVLSAYRRHGIRLAGRIRFGGWSILVLARGGTAMFAQRPGWH